MTGGLGSKILGAPSCSLCSKDYARVRAIAELARRLRGVQGTPPEVMTKLFLRWAELTGETVATDAMKALVAKWEAEDAADPAEKEARKR